MRTFDFIAIMGVVVAAFFAGVSYNADRIKATCDSDDTQLVMQGTEYLCLSPRHVEMLRRQQRSAMRGA